MNTGDLSAVDNEGRTYRILTSADELMSCLRSDSELRPGGGGREGLPPDRCRRETIAVARLRRLAASVNLGALLAGNAGVALPGPSLASSSFSSS